MRSAWQLNGRVILSVSRMYHGVLGNGPEYPERPGGEQPDMVTYEDFGQGN